MAYSFIKALLIVVLVMVGDSNAVISAENDHSVVRSNTGQYVHTSQANCVRTRWLSEHDSCAAQVVTQTDRITQKKLVVQRKTEARKTNELTQDEKTVYFDFNRSILIPEAKDRLNTLANIIKADQSVKEAKIVGFADRIGSNAYNQKLSQRRAESVRDYLIENGYTNARVTETRWVGEEEPSTNCSETERRSQLIKCLQKDRRVEVEMVYLKEDQRAQEQQ